MLSTAWRQHAVAQTSVGVAVVPRARSETSSFPGYVRCDVHCLDACCTVGANAQAMRLAYRPSAAFGLREGADGFYPIDLARLERVGAFMYCAWLGHATHPEVLRWHTAEAGPALDRARGADPSLRPVPRVGEPAVTSQCLSPRLTPGDHLLHEGRVRIS